MKTNFNIQERDVIRVAKRYLGVYYGDQKVKRNIKSLVAEGKTYKDIYQSLVYWYDIKLNLPSKSNGGISIVSYIYSEAMQYFDKKNKIDANKEKLSELKNYESETKEVTITSQALKKPKSIKLFDLE